MFCDILKVQKVQKPQKWCKPFYAAIADDYLFIDCYLYVTANNFLFYLFTVFKFKYLVK